MKLKIPKSKKLPLILVAVGVFFIGVGILAINSSRINPKWIDVLGVVVGSETKNVPGGTAYASILEYDADGKPYKITSQTAHPFSPQLGAEFLVSYNPANHAEAKVVADVKTPGHLKALPAIGVISLLAAVGIFILGRRQSAHDKRLPMTAPAHQVMQRPHDALDDIADSLAPIPAAPPAPAPAMPVPIQPAPAATFQQPHPQPQQQPLVSRLAQRPAPVAQAAQPAQQMTEAPRPAQPLQRPSLQQIQARRAQFAAQNQVPGVQRMPSPNRLVQ
jgi:hypothetical protein